MILYAPLVSIRGLIVDGKFRELGNGQHIIPAFEKEEDAQKYHPTAKILKFETKANVDSGQEEAK